MLKQGGTNGALALGGIPTVDTSGVPGAATINARAGRCAIAASAASVVVTNNQVTAASHVFAQMSGAGADATLTSLLRVTPGAGSFTITGNAAATAAVQVDFIVVD